MINSVTRGLKLAVGVVAGAAAVLVACLLAPRVLPAEWRETLVSSSLGGSESYLAEGNAPAGKLTYGFKLERIGRFVMHSARVTVEVDEQPQWTIGSSTHARDAALERIRIAFVKDCNDSATPELGGLFDAAWESQGHSTVYHYPWRGLVERCFYAVAVVGWFSAIVLLVATVKMLRLLPQWLAAGRRSRLGLCVHCGYDLAGTPGLRCPECGK